MKRIVLLTLLQMLQVDSTVVYLDYPKMGTFASRTFAVRMQDYLGSAPYFGTMHNFFREDSLFPYNEAGYIFNARDQLGREYSMLMVPEYLQNEIVMKILRAETPMAIKYINANQKQMLKLKHSRVIPINAPSGCLC